MTALLKHYKLDGKTIIAAEGKSKEAIAQRALGTLPLFKVRATNPPFIDEVVYVEALNARDAETAAMSFLVTTRAVPRNTTALTDGWDFCAFRTEEV